MARSDSGESVVERVVRILDAFDPQAERLALGEIARRASLPVSTAQRLVDQLVEQRLLHRDAEGRIGIGVRMWELASRASPTRPLREAALPYLEDLHAVVGHHAQLGVLDRGAVLFLERLSTPNSVVNITQIAGRLPLHASSSGLVLLAYATPALQEEILSRPMKRYTADTITDPRTLRGTLADIRHSRYVICPGHIHPDATGVAVPVQDVQGHMVAAISVVVPRESEPAQTVPVLQAAARGIRRALSIPEVRP